MQKSLQTEIRSEYFHIINKEGKLILNLFDKGSAGSLDKKTNHGIGVNISPIVRSLTSMGHIKNDIPLEAVFFQLNIFRFLKRWIERIW